MNIFELFVVQPIFNLLLFIYSIVPFADFGIAIILFTIIVRFAMWPLVVKQLHQVKAMRKLQPELARIKKATKGNRQLESMQMLELYKKHEVKPFRSILILLIQLPIFIALFQVIQIFTTHRDAIEKFTYEFMKGFDTVKELIANPDSFSPHFLGFVDLTRHAISSNGLDWFLILLAGIAAYTQYIISKQTSPTTSTKRLRDVLAEAGEGKQPDQAELNAVMTSKMIKFLPFLMFFIMLTLPGALALYYVTSNIFAAIQQHFLLKRDAKEMDTLADQEIKKTGKKATAKARAKEAREAETVKQKSTKKVEPNITRITAKDTPRK
ncbi:MAG: YidC/Oxa1 family membrane protein insertase [Candidatus Microsaccharimonas sp.]